ncbi:acyl-CoA N-acyltransferase [Apiospora hydei]|uniref:N-alpha-acetyltransferase 40 n=1 Tax=Apiospora hydei TaxID=1337664 RepID=A0ABR1VWU9_9PEZI
MATANRRQKRKRGEPTPIELVNKKDDAQFIADHLRPSPDWNKWTHPKTQEAYSLSLVGAPRLSEADLEACLALVEETSRADYEPSSMGWKPGQKRAEMKSPELRYVLVRDGKGGIRGFTSLMPTYEEGQPVVYCYEIHLKPELQGTGLGRQLLGYHEQVARHTPTVGKVMLTCFLSNDRALAFYRRLGFEKDEISPEPRKLRFGKVFVPDYVIMSKGVVNEVDADADAGADVAS